jgi:uncharacterized protein YihD (DUF1040 family)
MRDPERIPKILEEVEKIWMQNPDLRLGQLINNLGKDGSIYYLEDEALMKRMRRFYIEGKHPYK